MKKWIVRSILIVVAILLFVGIIPFEKEIFRNLSEQCWA